VQVLDVEARQKRLARWRLGRHIVRHVTVYGENNNLR
jgi:hypothetical protein